MASFRVIGVNGGVKKAIIVKDEPYYTTTSSALTKSFNFTFDSSKTYLVEIYAFTVKTTFSANYSGNTGTKTNLKNTMGNTASMEYMQYIDIVKGCSDTLNISFQKHLLKMSIGLHTALLFMNYKR